MHKTAIIKKVLTVAVLARNIWGSTPPWLTW